jgi:membrane protease YdiL (CAAX protease family)
MMISVALTGASFTLIHSPQLAHSAGPLALLFTVGVVITVARAASGSLAVSLLIHMSYNATLFVLLYLGTEGFRHLERMH